MRKGNVGSIVRSNNTFRPNWTANNAALCPDGADMCDNPHTKRLRGKNTDWSGVDGGWYSMLKDDDSGLHINVRLTAPLPEEFPDRQLITGLSVMSEGHSLVIEVTNPYDTNTYGCPRGVSPCLSDGRLRAVVDGGEAERLLGFSRDEHVPDGITVSVANLPAECRQFGGDKVWAHMNDGMVQGSRRLGLDEQLEDWVLISTKRRRETGSDSTSNSTTWPVSSPSMLSSRSRLHPSLCASTSVRTPKEALT